MKTTDLTAIWAAQSKPKLTASNVYFRGVGLYHWRSLVACLHPVERVALIWPSGEISDGTSMVCNAAANAARTAGYRVFRVPRANPESLKAHAENHDRYVARVADRVASIENALKPEDRRAEALAIIIEAVAYCETFGLGWNDPGPNPATVLSRRERAALEQRP